jgi:hypothetical protein
MSKRFGRNQKRKLQALLDAESANSSDLSHRLKLETNRANWARESAANDFVKRIEMSYKDPKIFLDHVTRELQSKVGKEFGTKVADELLKNMTIFQTHQRATSLAIDRMEWRGHLSGPLKQDVVTINISIPSISYSVNILNW